MLTSRFDGGLPGPVQDFLDKGADFVTAPDLDGLVAAMNELTGGDPKLDATAIEREIRARDADVTRPFGKDFQAAAIRLARSFLGRLPDAGGTAARAARPGGRAADRGPAARAHPQDARRPADRPVVAGAVGQRGAGAGAVRGGEAAGFGGGGMHGYRSLEGTFLGGCLFSGRIAGRAAASAVV